MPTSPFFPHVTYAFNAGFVRQGLISIYSLLVATHGKVAVVVHIDTPAEELSRGIKALSALFPDAQITQRINPDLPQQDHPHLKHGRPYTHWMMTALASTKVKTLYVDGDTLFVDDPTPLYHLDLEGKLLAGVPDTPFEILHHKIGFWSQFGALGAACSRPFRQVIATQKHDLHMAHYINAGLLLVDMPALRRAGLAEQLDDYKSYSQIYDQKGWTNYDQDWFNYLFGTQHDAIQLLSARWNLLANLANMDRFWAISVPGKLRAAYRRAQNNPALYHFAGSVFKPWQNQPLQRPMSPLQKRALGAWYQAAITFSAKTGMDIPPMIEKISRIAEKERHKWTATFA